MVDLTPLPGAVVEDAEIVLDTVNLRQFYRDDYIVATGTGIENKRSCVMSFDQDDVIQLKGGTTGASFEFTFYWCKAAVFLGARLFGNLTDNRRMSKRLMRAHCRWITVDREQETQADIDAAYKALEDAKKEAKDRGIFVVYEADVISLMPGETFTVKNDEDYYAENYFTEPKGMIQWGLAAEVRERQYNVTFDGNDNFGSEIERATKVKGLATRLYKWFKPTTPPPTDFELLPEEEGGLTEVTDKPLVDQFSDLLGGLGQGVKDAAGLAVIVLGTILAIILMMMFRGPLQGAAGGFTDFVKESLAR